MFYFKEKTQNYNFQGPTENCQGEWAPWLNVIIIIIKIIIIIIKAWAHTDV